MTSRHQVAPASMALLQWRYCGSLRARTLVSSSLSWLHRHTPSSIAKSPTPANLYSQDSHTRQAPTSQAFYSILYSQDSHTCPAPTSQAFYSIPADSGSPSERFQAAAARGVQRWPHSSDATGQRAPLSGPPQGGGQRARPRHRKGPRPPPGGWRTGERHDH